MSLQKLGPSSKIQLGSQQTNFLQNEKISEKDLNPCMTIDANAWFTVLHTTQDFTEIPEIGLLQKGLRSKSCHFGLFFTFTWARVYRV